MLRASWQRGRALAYGFMLVWAELELELNLLVPRQELVTGLAG